ncbi:dihydrodipicolinate synthetase [Catenulispora acidiphila DSM 44928]|uniref:Dihydrodipicolinate synthetase n=1 Tax=Catenulispora acidiphila (strain DSM 44928 / JCM 14897 / NBRC 102108 / NRRL B-24433 / ID139908) TaxID=479433 RepID=C7QI35_CATAD|nr:dihydrodipicolinate synthase family protein [Catenulispora acidiphila]ACU73080.1 dihydrodipicolinate synthetase [Catenulispora acidiphila DSM 44928]
MTTAPDDVTASEEVTASSLADLRARLATVVAIPVTPFTPDGDVDWGGHATVIRRLVDDGVQAVTPNGNTGEFYTLSEPEKRRAVESTVEAVDGRAEVVAGVGLDMASAVDAAQHAARVGASALMIHQPVHPYRSAEGWIEYHRVIADAVPRLGVILYVRDERVAGEHIATLARRSPNVIGVKYAVPDPVRFASVARDAGLETFAWIAGLAELSAPGYWAVGASGFTSGLVNVAPRLSAAMLDALRGGDFAKSMLLWETVREFEELRAADASADNVSVVKEALAQLGFIDRDVRPPSRTLPQALRDRITVVLEQWRVGGWL